MNDQTTDVNQAQSIPNTTLNDGDVSASVNQQGQEEQTTPDTVNVSIAGMQNLTAIVLDAAGAANQAVKSANKSAHMLLDSVTKNNAMAKSFHKTNRHVLSVIVVLGAVGLLSGGAMVYVLHDAVRGASAINSAMGTRLVGFEKQMDRVNMLETQMIDLADVNLKLGQSVEQVMQELKEVGSDSNESAVQQSVENQLMLQRINDQVSASFDDLKDTTKTQQGVLAQVKKSITNMQLQMQKIQNQDLVAKVEALVSLGQTRYFELEQKKLAISTAKLEEKKAAKVPAIEDTYITFGVALK